METKSRAFISAVFVTVVLAAATSACSSSKGSTGVAGTGDMTATAGTTTPPHLLRVSSLPSFTCPKVAGPPNNQQCLSYADVPQIVVGRSATGAVLIEVPVDGCGHYEPDALNALVKARGNR